MSGGFGFGTRSFMCLDYILKNGFRHRFSNYLPKTEREDNCWEFDLAGTKQTFPGLHWELRSTLTYVSPEIPAWIGKRRMRFTGEHPPCAQLWLEEQVPFSYGPRALGLEGGTRTALSSGILDPQLFCCQLSSLALAKSRFFLRNERKVPAQDG